MNWNRGGYFPGEQYRGEQYADEQYYGSNSASSGTGQSGSARREEDDSGTTRIVRSPGQSARRRRALGPRARAHSNRLLRPPPVDTRAGPGRLPGAGFARQGVVRRRGYWVFWAALFWAALFWAAVFGTAVFGPG